MMERRLMGIKVVLGRFVRNIALALLWAGKS
jgi:hypothetical protein